MNTNNNCCEQTSVQTSGCHGNYNSFLIIVVLYILLAIIVGTYLY